MNKYKKLMVLTALTAALGTSGLRISAIIGAKTLSSIFITSTTSAARTASSVRTKTLPVKAQLPSSTT